MELQAPESQHPALTIAKNITDKTALLREIGDFKLFRNSVEELASPDLAPAPVQYHRPGPGDAPVLEPDSVVLLRVRQSVLAAPLQSMPVAAHRQ